jgi:hypothetical protein
VEEGKARDRQVPMTKRMQVVNHARQLIHALTLQSGKPSTLMLVTVEPTQSEVCSALFDTIAAAQAALVANNCPGV